MRSPTVTPKLQRLAAQAAHDPDRVFTTLAHLIDTDFLREAYRQTSKSSAAGIDGVTAQQYAEHLEENLRDLHEPTSKTSTTARMAFGQDAAPMMHCRNYGSGA